MDTEATIPPVSLWRNHDYVLLLCGQAVNVVGTKVSQIAYPLLVLTLTNSPTQAGFVAAARAVPYLLFSLPAGALVDRWDRKVVMILCSAGSAVALASLCVAYALGVLIIAQIVAVSFIEGTLGLVFGLAEASALPRVVTPDQLPQAIAQQNAQYSLGALLGPPIGGVLYGVSHLLPFLADACSYAVSAGALALTRVRFQSERTGARPSLSAEIGEGVRWIWRQPLIRYMAFLTGSLNFTSGMTLVLVVVATREGASPAIVGVIFAFAGAGGLVGALLAPLAQRRLTFGQAILCLCWFNAVIYASFVFARTPAMIAVLLVVYFLVSPTYDTVQLSYRLSLIPDVLQGRVNSAFRLVAQGMGPPGIALTGILIERIGTTATILAIAGWLGVIALLTTANRHVRQAPALVVRT